MIADIIKELNKHNHYGVGTYIELAKGKNEYITSWRDFKRKIKRIWLLPKQ